MDEDLFKSLLAYKSIMAQAKVLLRRGIITRREYTHFDTIHALTKHDHPLTEWEESMWQMTVDTVIVQPDGKLLFRFQNGLVVEE